MRALLNERGLVITEHLSMNRHGGESDRDFCGFVAVVAAADGMRPFGAIRLNDPPVNGRRSYAELFLLDA